MSGLKAVLTQVLEAGRIREALLAEQARQVSQIAGLLLEAARGQRTLHVLGEGELHPLAQFLAARFRGDGEALLVPARALPVDLDPRQFLAYAHAEDALLVLSASGTPALGQLLRQATSQGVSVSAIFGRDAASLASLTQASVILPQAPLPVTAEVVLSLGHVLCALLSQGLGQLRPVPSSDGHDAPAPFLRDSHSDGLELKPESDEGVLLADAVENGYSPPTDPHGRTWRSREEEALEPPPPTDPRFRFRCGACEAVISVKPKHCGKRGRCPHCQAEFTIPQRTSSSGDHFRPTSSVQAIHKPSVQPETPSRQPSAEEHKRPSSSAETQRSGSGRAQKDGTGRMEKGTARTKRRRRRGGTSRERRRAPRVEVKDSIIRISTEAYPDAQPGYADPHSLDDLSLTGLRFVGPSRRYEVGDVLFLSIDFPAFPLPVRIKGEIRRIESLGPGQGFGSGVRFLEYVGDAESQIRRLLEGDRLREVRRR